LRSQNIIPVELSGDFYLDFKAKVPASNIHHLSQAIWSYCNIDGVIWVENCSFHGAGWNIAKTDGAAAVFSTSKERRIPVATLCKTKALNRDRVIWKIQRRSWGSS
jgi:hypothetical protein